MRLPLTQILRIQPIQCIEAIIAFFTFVGGLYLFTPLYEISVSKVGLTGLGAALSNPMTVLLWGAILLVGALLVMLGLLKNMPQLKSIGWFSIVLARFFQILTVIITTGPFPITWFYPLTLMFVCVILWWAARSEMGKHSAS